MPWGNQKHIYGKTSRLFHLGMALLVFVIVALAWYADSLPRGPEKGELFFWHKSVGVLLLGLAIVRLIWHRFSPVPPALVQGRQAKLVKAGHCLLYALMVAMPALGLVMSVAGGRDVQVFNWFTIPGWDSKVEWLGSAAHSGHLLAAKLLIAVIVLHVAAALYHKLVARDGVWERMFGR
ncbi:cytochrome b [Zobellella maritima]|uniref:cytochrome b n=1 Tax=Zobellella maritima TaxID=2059725 RepID=UPI000E3070F8|nr:cytochrome b [Zobellella maritima]